MFSVISLSNGRTCHTRWQGRDENVGNGQVARLRFLPLPPEVLRLRLQAMDEKIKQRVMMAVVGFNLTIIIYQIGFNSSFFGNQFSATRLFGGIVLALIVAGICFMVVKLTQR